VLSINSMLTALNDEFGYFVAHERNTFRPAGVARFARFRGAHLVDDPSSGRLVTVGFAYSEYIRRRYGRFPTSTGRFRTTAAYQAHRLDPDFYDRFYRPRHAKRA
jgi:hypothetical protein